MLDKLKRLDKKTDVKITLREHGNEVIMIKGVHNWLYSYITHYLVTTYALYLYINRDYIVSFKACWGVVVWKDNLEVQKKR